MKDMKKKSGNDIELEKAFEEYCIKMNKILNKKIVKNNIKRKY